MKSVLTGIALVWIGASAVSAQPDAALAQRLDSIAGAAVAANTSVGIVAAVFKENEPLLVKAYGKADTETGAPMTVDTILPLASVTKQFTAVAILQLRDQGKLGLDDEITKWLPDFDTRGNKVTLRHLLGHTSGVADHGSIAELRALRPIMNPSVTRDDVYKFLRSQPFQFPPGSMQVYSNAGYWLLGRVVEKASGLSYEDYVRRKLFEPLRMSRSMYCGASPGIPRRARGHGIRNGVTRQAPEIVHTVTFSAGALCSTVEDTIVWLRALHGGKFLSQRSYADLIAPSRLADGTTLQYSMGLSVAADSRRNRYVGHSGGGFGYSSEARWYPDAKLAVVVLTNSEPDAITATTEEIAAAVLPPRPAPAAFPGDAALLAGKYKGPGRAGEMLVDVTATAEGIAFSVAGGPGGPLSWVEDWKFHRNSSLLTFRRTAADGPPTVLSLDTGGDHFILRRQ